MAVVLVKKDYRFPIASLQTPVDALRLGSHFGNKILITLDTRPAGGPELDKRELLPIVRTLVEKTFDCPEPLYDSLCVIHAIHTDSQEKGFRPQLRQDVRAVL